MQIKKTLCTFSPSDPDESCFEQVVMFLDQLRSSALVRVVELQFEGEMGTVASEKLLALSAAFIDREEQVLVYAGGEALFLAAPETMQFHFNSVALVDVKLSEKTKTTHKAVRFVYEAGLERRECYFYPHDRRLRGR